MLTMAESDKDSLVRCLMPGVRVYLAADPAEVDPYESAGLFRGEECFEGTLKGWRRWQKPSPEPKTDSKLREIVIAMLKVQADHLCALHDRLLEKMLDRIPARPLVFVSILRAGVFIAQGLARRMKRYGYSEPPVVAIGLFHEAGFDFSAFSSVLKDYPGHFPVFVDGWTGRGVVARELKRAYAVFIKNHQVTGLPAEPMLATLVDPGHHSDLYAMDRDTPVPCAHFTAPEVFGFSRAFIKSPVDMWYAYNYPQKYFDPNMVGAWLGIFDQEVRVSPMTGANSPQVLSELLEDIARCTGTLPGQWKVNVNEVVRSFVNRSPKELLIGVPEEKAEFTVPDLLYLSKRAGIPVRFRADMSDIHNCLAAVRLL